MSRRFHIGVSPCFFHPDPTRNVFKGKTLLYFEESLVKWVQRGGALPVLVPTDEGSITIDDVVSGIDGLVLEGGADMSPRSYGEAPLQPEWEGDAIRDAYEIALLRACVAKGKPVFGVCRGLQVINVAYGGTLWQDIPTLHPKGKVHRDREVYDQLFHDVAIEPGSWLERTFGCSRGRINSVHHQGIRRLGEGLIAEAHSEEDGLVEAVRAASGPTFVAGVQWHPEFQDTSRTDLLSPTVLFARFLEEVALASAPNPHPTIESANERRGHSISRVG